MRILTFLLQQRRWLVLALLSLLFHALALSWAAGGLAMAPSPRPPSAMLVAQLKASPPAPAPAPAVRPKPVPKPRPEAEAAVAQEAAPQAESAPVLAESAPPEPVAAPAPAAAPEQARAPEPPAPLASVNEDQTPPFQVKLPPPAELSLEVVERRGPEFERSASGSIRWRTEGDAYEVRMTAGLRALVRITLLETKSTGQLGVHGLEPQTYSESVMLRARTDTHFNRDQHTISFSRVEGQVPLNDGAQDRTSMLLQLAAIANADPQQLEHDFSLQVAEAREANVYRFVFVGREDIETRLGTLHTWHVARPPRPGAYNQRLDIWLAPQHAGFPVRFSQTNPRGDTVTNTVTEIQIQ